MNEKCSSFFERNNIDIDLIKKVFSKEKNKSKKNPKYLIVMNIITLHATMITDSEEIEFFVSKDCPNFFRIFESQNEYDEYLKFRDAIEKETNKKLEEINLNDIFNIESFTKTTIKNTVATNYLDL